MTDQITLYGFTYGPASINRVCTIGKETRVLSITERNDHKELLTIYISKTGRSIRVFKGRKELK